MRNPNGYGSVTKLSGHRRNPYWVKKTIGWNDKGYPIYETIGYAPTREEGNIMLAEYNKNPYDVDKAKITLKELFKLWSEKKLPKLSKGNSAVLKSAYKHIKKLDDMPYKEIKAVHMQDTIDNCGLSYSTQSIIKSLWYHLDRFAIELDISSKSYSALLSTAPIPETSRKPFTTYEIKRVWKMYNDYQAGENFDGIPVEWIDTVLIFLYTGFRFSELLTIKTSDVDLNERTIKGGIKTAAGKNRIVPIHSAIYPMIVKRYDPNNDFLINCRPKQYRNIFTKLMNYLNIDKTPHECRHTFETMLDSAGANRRCIDLMMGHASRDVGNRVYNHKTLAELRTAIELFEVNK